MKKWICLLVVLVFTNSTNAATVLQEGLAKCVEKKNDAVRLICYDALAKSLGAIKPTVTQEVGDVGKWLIRSAQSDVDDSTNVFLLLNANEEVGSGYKQSRPQIVLRCMENKTNAYMDWGQYLGIGETRMLTRIDAQKATTRTWNISTDNKAVFVRGSDITFTKSLMGHEKLLAKITPYSENPVTVTFDIHGLSEAIKPLRKACGW